MIDFKQFGLAVTLSVTMLAPELAQAQPGALSAAANETTTLPWSAPVGHRQPRAADIPASSSRQMIDPEDANVDRMIKGVCRGC